jgi:hypothetical protein
VVVTLDDGKTIERELPLDKRHGHGDMICARQIPSKRPWLPPRFEL